MNFWTHPHKTFLQRIDFPRVSSAEIENERVKLIFAEVREQIWSETRSLTFRFSGIFVPGTYPHAFL